MPITCLKRIPGQTRPSNWQSSRTFTWWCSSTRKASIRTTVTNLRPTASSWCSKRFSYRTLKQCFLPRKIFWSSAPWSVCKAWKGSKFTTTSWRSPALFPGSTMSRWVQSHTETFSWLRWMAWFTSTIWCPKNSCSNSTRMRKSFTCTMQMTSWWSRQRTKYAFGTFTIIKRRHLSWLQLNRWSNSQDRKTISRLNESS